MKLYRIVDRHTKLQVGTYYKSLRRANRRVDTLDNIYGGYRYHVELVKGGV